MSQNQPPPQSPPNRPKVTREDWSPISQGDLGLKAGYWVPGSTEITFREIVGWVTVNFHDPLDLTFQRREFVPIVLPDFGYPRPAEYLPNFLAVFRKDIASAEAMKLKEERRKEIQADAVKINVPGKGQA